MPILVTRDAEYESRESRDEAALVYRRCAEEKGRRRVLGVSCGPREVWSRSFLLRYARL